MILNNIILIFLIAYVFIFEAAYFTHSKFLVDLEKKNGSYSASIIYSFYKNENEITFSLKVIRIFLIILLLSFTFLFLFNTIFFIEKSLIIQLITILSVVSVEFVFILIISNLCFLINTNTIIAFLAVFTKVVFIIFKPITLTIRFLENIFSQSTHEKRVVEFVIAKNSIKTEEQHNEEVSEKHEIQMIQNVIDFSTVKIHECMIPRTEIVSINVEQSISELKKTFIESGLSKIVVFQNTIDNILGYVHSFDIFKNPESIKAILRKGLIVPETMQASQLLSLLINQHKSMAIVVDEFGGTSGIITLEDVMEEIFGEINDELDINELTEKKLNNFEYLFSARHEIDYLNEKYNLELPESEDYKTINGLIFHYYENIPKKGSFLQVENFYFQILEASETRVELVKLKIINKKN